MAIRKTQLQRPARALMPLVLGAACALWSSLCPADIPGYPSSIEAYDSREVAMLPRYCIHTQLFREHVPGGGNAAEIGRWRAMMGETFDSLHHYCWGLMKINRGTILARSQQDRLHYLTDSIREFDYVIERAPPDFVLLPEILTRRGETLVKLGRATQGIADLQQAIEAKPDYWPPYAALSDHYKSVGETAKARELLEKAMSFAPESTGLKRRLAELGGGIAKARPAPKPAP